MEAYQQSALAGRLIKTDVDEKFRHSMVSDYPISLSASPAIPSHSHKKQCARFEVTPFRCTFDSRAMKTRNTDSSDLLSQTLPLFPHESPGVSKSASGGQESGRRGGIEGKILKKKPLSGTLVWLKQEMESISRRLENRRTSVRAIVLELGTTDCNNILFKNKLQKELSSLDSDLKQSSSNITALMNDRIRMVKMQEELQAANKKLVEENKIVNERMSVQAQSLSQIKEELSILKEENDYISAQNADRKKIIEECQYEKNNLDEKLTNKNSEINSLENQVRELRLDLGNRSEKLQSILQEMREQQTEIQKLVQVVVELRADNVGLRKSLEQYLERLDELETQQDLVQKENDSLKQFLLSGKAENLYRQELPVSETVQETEVDLLGINDFDLDQTVQENPEGNVINQFSI